MSGPATAVAFLVVVALIVACIALAEWREARR